VKECEMRTPNLSVKSFPCGFEDECFLDVNDNNKCKSSCLYPEHYEKVNGICKLKFCKERINNGSESYSCGSSDCFLDINNECSRSCSSSEHYKPSDGKCVLKDCGERIKNDSDDYPCGSDGCYLDNSENEKCVAMCLNANHYEVVNNVCVLKNCIERTSNSSNLNPCGSSDCYLDVNDNKCKISCSYSEHYEGVNGTCVLKKCEESKVNGSDGDIFRCGKKCLYDEYDKTCKSFCESFYINSSGTCVLERNCMNRNATDEKDFGCGSDCLLLKFKSEHGDFKKVCLNECPEHYKNTLSNGNCEQINCNERKVSEDRNYICSLLENDEYSCFSFEGKCYDNSCPQNTETVEMGGIGSHMCKKLPCTLRSPIEKENNSCSYSDDHIGCYLFNETSCVTSCPKYSFPRDDRKSSDKIMHTCVLLDCESRVPFPDKNSSCFINSKINEDCFNSEGRCVKKCEESYSVMEGGICDNEKSSSSKSKKGNINILFIFLIAGIIVATIIITIVVIVVVKRRKKKTETKENRNRNSEISDKKKMYRTEGVDFNIDGSCLSNEDVSRSSSVKNEPNIEHANEELKICSNKQIKTYTLYEESPIENRSSVSDNVAEISSLTSSDVPRKDFGDDMNENSTVKLDGEITSNGIDCSMNLPTNIPSSNSEEICFNNYCSDN
jgi:hypothetical protein